MTTYSFVNKIFIISTTILREEKEEEEVEVEEGGEGGGVPLHSSRAPCPCRRYQGRGRTGTCPGTPGGVRVGGEDCEDCEVSEVLGQIIVCNNVVVGLEIGHKVGENDAILQEGVKRSLATLKMQRNLPGRQWPW